MSAGLVQGLKALFGRARPDDILIDIASGAYPSGHAANAATVGVLLTLLVPRWWVALVGALAAWAVVAPLVRRERRGAPATVGT